MSRLDKLPTGWELVNLGKLGSFINGDRGKNYPSQEDFCDSGIPFINAGHIQDGNIDLDSMNYISEERFNLLGSGKIKPNDIVYCLRGSLGKTAIVKGINQGAIASSLVIIRPFDCVLTDYLYYFLTSSLGQSEILKYDNGSSQPNLSAKSVKEYTVPVPPLEEQRRIAAILDKADAVRRKRQQAIALTEKLLRSAFLEMFGDPVTNPKGWEVSQLKNFSVIQSGIAKGKKIDRSKAVSIPYMRVANVQDGYLDLREIKKLEILPTDINKYILREGDLLLTEGGDPDKLGRGAIWYGKIKPCVHQNHIFCVRPDQTLAEPEYLSALIGSERGKRYFLQAAKQTTGIATINKTQLCGFPAFLPPLYLQQKYTQIVKLIRFTRTRLDDKYEQTDKLFNSLIQRAFSGKI